MDVKLMKLLTGEEILAEVISSDEMEGNSIGSIKIRNPVRLVVMPSQRAHPEQGINIGMAPWAEFSSDKEFVLDKFHVVVIMTPADQFVAQYNKIFGGIVAVSAPKLIIPGALPSGINKY